MRVEHSQQIGISGHNATG